jgi:hypothetical protein
MRGGFANRLQQRVVEVVIVGHGKLLLNLWLHDIVLLSGPVLLNLKHGELLIL